MAVYFCLTSTHSVGLYLLCTFPAFFREFCIYFVDPECLCGGGGPLEEESFGLLELAESLCSLLLGGQGGSCCLLKEADCLLVFESFVLFLCSFRS